MGISVSASGCFTVLLLSVSGCASRNVFELKVGTLYPLLHSMVQSGYLESYNQEANGKLRKYYRITPNGKKYLEKMIEEWNAYANAVTSMIQYSV